MGVTVDKSELMIKLHTILEEAKFGVLATTDKENKPRMRWMTPAFIKGRDNAIFTVSSPHFKKIKDLEQNPDVEWMIQTPALDQVINIKGKVNILDNPAIKAEVLEQVGKRITTFWKLNQDLEDYVILETIITEATYFQPMKNKKSKVEF